MKHWIFDLDGTLADSDVFYEGANRKILEHFGFTVTQADLDRGYQFFNPQDYYATYFTDPRDVEKAVSLLIEMGIEATTQIPLFDGVEELIQYLRSKNVRVSVWTGRDIKTAKMILDHTGLTPYLEFCVGRTCVDRNKPYPDGLLKILKDAREHGDDAIMIGDHRYDMEGARAAKVKGFSVDWNGTGRHGAHELSDRHFTSVRELHDWARAHYG